MNTNKEFMKSIASKGAAASKEVQRAKALAKYAEVDPHCKQCGKPIPPPPIEKKTSSNSWAKAARRTFCSSKCVQDYSWKNGKDLRLGKRFTFQQSEITLGELKSMRNTWDVTIRRNAQLMYKLKSTAGKPTVCEKCQWPHHINVCHIKAIQDFPDTATVKEINALDNLIGLCPNCHWLFDHPIDKEKALEFLPSKA